MGATGAFGGGGGLRCGSSTIACSSKTSAGLRVSGGMCSTQEVGYRGNPIFDTGLSSAPHIRSQGEHPLFLLSVVMLRRNTSIFLDELRDFLKLLVSAPASGLSGLMGSLRTFALLFPE